MKEYIFHNHYHLLVSESELIEWMLYTGLTLIRNSNEAPNGKTTSGFYNLSIGIERLCKLIIITNHMSNNKLVPPSNSTIKSYSHDIRKLILNIINDSSIKSDSLISTYQDTTQDIISLLSEFGRSTRYQNINELSTNDKTTDPLIKWQAILKKIYKNEMPQYTKKKILEEGLFYTNMFKNNSYFLLFDLNRETISQDDIFSHFSIQEKSIARAVRHLVLFLLSLRTILIDVGDKARTVALSTSKDIMIIPYFNDFMKGLLGSKSNLLTKKRWQNV